MKKLLLIPFYIIQFTWGILQNFLGLIIFIKMYDCTKEYYHGSIITYHKGSWGGVSLGIFVFINGSREDDWKAKTKVHEYGHTIQSLILGPLYLFIIGIPSTIWCKRQKYIKYREKNNISYFALYTEKWANILGERFTKEKAPL